MMKREVFYIYVTYSTEDFSTVVGQRIHNLEDYSLYFISYEAAKNYLEKLMDDDPVAKEKYKDYPHHEYSIHKVWIDEDR